MRAKLLQSCPTLCNPMDCSLPAPLSMEFPGKNSRVGFHDLLQGIFPTQGSNPRLSCLWHHQAFFLSLTLFEKGQRCRGVSNYDRKPLSLELHRRDILKYFPSLFLFVLHTLLIESFIASPLISSLRTLNCRTK